MNVRLSISFCMIGLASLSGTPAGRSGEASVNKGEGVIRHGPDASAGYTLFCPLPSKSTYLIDMKGNVVNQWESDYDGVGVAYLLDDGRLLRAGLDPDNRLPGGGRGGIVEEWSWDGERRWEFRYSDDSRLLHHDIEPLPNGNVLMIAWERKSRSEALNAGRDPALLATGDFWPDHVIEVEPTRPSGGKIVWEWHVWDHVIQDHDRGAANFGDVAAHPELVDLNGDRGRSEVTDEERDALEQLGYLGGSDGGKHVRAMDEGAADWLHTNAIAYDARRDQIALSVLHFNEVWVIDHGTTTAEARSHEGGKCGKGGDLLYRWGNPRAYRRGNEHDQRLFGQHDVRWIPDGHPGAGRFLVFNNGDGRPGGAFSTVEEWEPPIDEDGGYVLGSSNRFGPEEVTWSYVATPRESLFSRHVSGAERLPNGNTLICSGQQGRLIEVTGDGEVVWEYVNPFTDAERADAEFPNAIFRATRISLEHPAVRERDLGARPPAR